MDGTVAANLIVHVGADIADAMRGLDQVDQRVQSSGQNFGAASRLMAVGAGGIFAGLTAATKAAGDFESVMNLVGAVSGATGSEFQSLSTLALKIGKDTVFGATEGAQAIAELSKAGIEVKDILDGAAMAAANLAAAGGVEMPKAATMISTAMNLFQLGGDQAANVADVIAAAANKSAADVNDLGLAMAQVGPGAAQMGLSLEGTLAALALFSDYGLRGSDAGTSLKRMLQLLTPTGDKAAKVMRKLGLDFFDAQGNFVGFDEVVSQLGTALAGLSDEQRQTALNTLFGSDASRAAAIFFRSEQAAAAGAGDSWNDYRLAVTASGAASEVGQARMAGMNGALEELRGSLETVMIIVGTHFTPAVELAADTISQLTDGFATLDPALQGLIANGALAVGAVLGLGAALGTIMLAAGPVVSALLAIAAPLTVLVAAGAALVVAWQNNFYGIQQVVQSVAGRIVPVLQRAWDVLIGGVGYFQELISQGASPFATVLMTLESVLVRVFGGDNPIVQFFHATRVALLNLRNYFGLIIADGDHLNDWLTRFPAGIQPVVRWLGALGAMAQKVVEGFGAGGLRGALAAFAGFLPMLAREGANYLGSLVTLGGDIIGAIWRGLQDRWPEVRSWFTDTAMPALGTIAAGVHTLFQAGWQLVTRLWEGIQQRWPAVSAWITGTALPAIGAALRTGWDALTSAAGTLFDHVRVGAQMAWAKLAPWLTGSALPAIGSALSGAWETLKTAGAALFDKIKDGITENWPSIASFLHEDGLPNIVAAITSKVAEFVGAGMSIIGSILRGIYENRDSIGAFIKDYLLPGILLALATGPTLLLLAGKGIIGGLLMGLQDVWNNQLGPWLKGVVAGIPGAIAAIVATDRLLDAKGQEIIGGLLRGLQHVWNNQLGPWLKDVIAGIPGAILAADRLLDAKGQEIIGSLVRGMQNIWNNQLGPWLKSVISGIPGAVLAADRLLDAKGQEIITGLVRGLQHVWNNTLAPWLKGVVAGIPGALGNLGSLLSAKGQEIVAGLLVGLQDVWNNQLSPWLKGVLGGLADPSLFSTAIFGIVQRGGDVIATLLRGLQDAWNNRLAPWLKGALGGLTNPSLFSTAIFGIVQRGGDVIATLLRGLQDAWNNRLAPWLKTVIAGLPGLFANAGTWLVESGRAIIDGLRHGIVDVWNNQVSTWLSGAKATFQRMFAGASSWLSSSGQQIIDGLRHGVQDYWNNRLWPFVTGIDDTIIGFFANAGTWLITAGEAIIQGLIDGIGNMAAPLGDALGAVGTFIEENKGPIEKDRRLLRPAGMAIMEGLSAAIRAGIERSLAPALREATRIIPATLRQASVPLPSLAGMAGPAVAPQQAGMVPAWPAMAPVGSSGRSSAFADVRTPSAPSGQTVIHQTNHITVNLQELRELVEAGKFVRDLGPTRTLYLGTT